MPHRLAPHLPNGLEHHSVLALRGVFCRTAAPDIIWSDGGPQFTSGKFQAFLKDWGVYHQRSNGKAEATIKSMKQLIKAAWKRSSFDKDSLARALRNTPCRRDGMSPAQKLYGRPIQDSLPAHRRSFAAEWQQPISEEQTHRKAESFYDQHAHPLPDLSPRAQVAIQNPVSKRWDVYCVVTAVSPHRRYSIHTSSGQVFVRNRRFLRKQTAPSIYAPPYLPKPYLVRSRAWDQLYLLIQKWHLDAQSALSVGHVNNLDWLRTIRGVRSDAVTLSTILEGRCRILTGSCTHNGIIIMSYST